MMRKDDFITRIAINLAIPAEDVKKAVDFSLDEATKAMADKESVEVSGFGTFYFRKGAVPYYLKALDEKIGMLKKKFASSDNKELIKDKIETFVRNREILRKRYEME